MDKKQPIKQALKLYYKKHSLDDNQLTHLQALANNKQAENKRQRQPLIRNWLAGMAASITLALTLIVLNSTPVVIHNAYADISHDAQLFNGMQPAQQSWLKQNQIAALPQQYPVEMSKYCKLDTIKSTHLRIAGEHQGVLHLFFHKGRSTSFWHKHKGRIDNMHWKVVKLQNNLTLIALYSEDMKDSAVNHIIESMQA